MTGFVTGAADSISKGMDDRKKRKDKREDDLFSLRSQVYMKNLSKIDEQKAAEEERRSTISAVAEQYGWNKDQVEAFSAKAITNKWDPGSIKDMADKYDVNVAPETKTMDTEIPSKVPSAIDETKSMISSERKPTSSNPTPIDKALNAGMDDFVKFMSEGTGQSEDEVRMTMTGKTVPKMTSALSMKLIPKSESMRKLLEGLNLENVDEKIAVEAQLGNEKAVEMMAEARKVMIQQRQNTLLQTGEGAEWGQATWTDEDGKPQAARLRFNEAGVWLPNKKGEASKVGKPYSALAADFQITKGSDVKISDQLSVWKQLSIGGDNVYKVESLTRDAGEMVRLSEQDVAAGTVAGAGMQMARKALVEFASGLDLANIASNGEGFSSVKQAMMDKIAAIDETDFGGNSKSLVVKRIDFAYQWLETKNQSGKAVQNEEFNRMFEALFDPDPKKLRRLMVDVVKGSISAATPSWEASRDLSTRLEPSLVPQTFEAGSFVEATGSRFKSEDSIAAGIWRDATVPQAVAAGAGPVNTGIVNQPSESLPEEVVNPENPAIPTTKPQAGNKIKNGDIEYEILEVKPNGDLILKDPDGGEPFEVPYTEGPNDAL